MRRQESSPWASFQFCFLLFLASCCLSSGIASAVDLAGKIKTQGGEINGALINLKLENFDGSLVDQRTIGSDGRFEFDGLTRSQFRLRAEAPGFQPLEQDVDLTGPRDNVYIDLVLMPLSKSAPPASELSSLTDESAPKKARHEYEKGARALQDQKLDDAALHFKNAVTEYPCYARAQSDLARVLVLQSKVPEAEASLKKSIACDGGFIEAYTRLAMLLNGTKRYPESEKILEEGLRRAPSSWNLYYQLGATHSSEGQLEKAVEDYLKARSLNPAAPSELHVRLADLYHRMKAYDRAYAEMQAYLRDDPNGRYADRTRAVMHEMESSGLVHTFDTPPPHSQP